LVDRRGAFSAAWLALSHVDPPEIKDPVLLHAPTRKSVGYFGAVRLRDGRFVFRRETGKFRIGHGHTRHGLGRLSAECTTEMLVPVAA
jgi:hypothetical protein